MPSTRPQIYRLMIIDREIRAGRYPNSIRLAELLEVSGRTIQRDIEFLRDSLGAPLEFDPIHNGYLYTEKTFFLPTQQLSEGELLAMLVADKALGEFRGTAFEGALKRIFEKVAAALPEEVSVSPQELARAYEFQSTAPVHCDPEIFRALQEAIRDTARCEVVYHTASRSETKRRKLDPYRLVNIDSEWYLLAHCHEHEEVRVFRPSRIREIRRTGETFRMPSEFDAAEFLSTKFHAMAGDKPVKVRIRFDPSLAGYISERDWPEGSRCQFLTDGGVDLTLVTENIDALLRWTLGWGPGAQVLSPPWIRRRMRETVRRVLQRYQARAARPARAGRTSGAARKVFKPPSRSRKSS
jgi:proteasome accessory factor B